MFADGKQRPSMRLRGTCQVGGYVAGDIRFAHCQPERENLSQFGTKGPIGVLWKVTDGLAESSA